MMTLEEARDHVGETLVHKFLDKPAEEAELVSVGNHALHVRFAGAGEVVTMHPRHFSLKAGRTAADCNTALRKVAALVSAALRNGAPELEAELYPVAFLLGDAALAGPEAVARELRKVLGLKAAVRPEIARDEAAGGVYKVEGKDGFDLEADFYPIGEWSSYEEALEAARDSLAELNVSQPHAGGQLGIQDRVYIVRPDGRRERIFS